MGNALRSGDNVSQLGGEGLESIIYIKRSEVILKPIVNAGAQAVKKKKRGKRQR